MASFVPQAEAQGGRFSSDRYTVASTPFAGRIGTNQEFSVQSAADAEVLENDARRGPIGAVEADGQCSPICAIGHLESCYCRKGG